MSLLLGFIEMASSKLVPALDESFHKVPSNSNTNSYICATCGKHIQSSSGFRRHMMSHGEKLYKCLICTKTFTDRHHFEGHVNKHQDIKPFSCQRCKMEFSYKLRLMGIRVFAIVRARTRRNTPVISAK